MHPDSIIVFADYLLACGDFVRACVEYERALSCDIPDSGKAGLLEKKAGCYMKLGEYDSAAALFRALVEGERNDSLILRYGAELYGAYASGGDSDKALAAARMLKKRTGSVKAVAMEISTCLIRNDTAGASSAFSDGVTRVGSDSAYFSLFDSWLGRYKSLPRKSCFAAGLLSAVVPGSGKMYVGRVRDGFFAALFTTFFSLQCYDGFRRNGCRTVKGWIFFPIALSFYTGNIYGSVIEARLCNYRKRKELLHDIEFSLKVQILGH